MAHPQSSPRGFIAKARIDAGSQSVTYNSTGLILAGALYLSGKSNTKLTANTTGVIASGAVFVSGQTTVGKITANSTALVLPATGLQMAALSSLKITSNSTGIKIGARYISTNTTGNSTT